MKKTLTAFTVLLFCCQAFAQTTLSWSGPVVVTSGSQYGSVRPRIALTTGDVPVVVWGDLSPRTCYSSRWNGTSFSAPVQVNPAGLSPYIGSADGPNVAASGDTVFVAFFNYGGPDYKVYSVRSVDGGSVWQDTVQVDQLPLQNDEAYSPYVAVKSGGNPVVIFEKSDFTGTGNIEQMVNNSQDGGQTWGTSVTASALSPGQPCECCPPEIVVKGNTQLALYRNNDNDIRDIFASVSTDGGASFTSSTEIDYSNFYIPSCPSSGPSGHISGDTLITVWMTEGNGAARINIGTYNFNTLQVGFNAEIDNTVPPITTQNYPVIAGNKDTMAVVWQDNRNLNWDTYLAFSYTGATGFGSPWPVFDTSLASNQQVSADVAYSNGTFHVVYRNQSTDAVIYRTATVVDSPVGNNNYINQALAASASPNPFSKQTLLKFNNPQGGLFKAELLDIEGKLLREYHNISGNELLIEREGLPAGTYFYSISTGMGKKATGKLVVQ